MLSEEIKKEYERWSAQPLADADLTAELAAMDEEQMPWTQLLVPKESTKAMGDAYQVRSIPYLMIIDQEGRVMMTTHNPESAHTMIKRLIAD